MARAQQLVGGRASLTVPSGATAGAWLIGEDFADLFIGYAHYAVQMTESAQFRTLLIPEPWNIRCSISWRKLRGALPRGSYGAI